MTLQHQAEEEPMICGRCVHANGRMHAPEVDCARHGRRRGDAWGCDHWFGMAQLRAELYGRGVRK